MSALLCFCQSALLYFCLHSLSALLSVCSILYLLCCLCLLYCLSTPFFACLRYVSLLYCLSVLLCLCLFRLAWTIAKEEAGICLSNQMLILFIHLPSEILTCLFRQTLTYPSGQTLACQFRQTLMCLSGSLWPCVLPRQIQYFWRCSTMPVSNSCRSYRQSASSEPRPSTTGASFMGTSTL